MKRSRCNRVFRASGLSIVAFMLIVGTANAQYPNRAVKLIVAYPPGGLPDTVARVVGQRLAESLGQPFIVDNKPGAGGVVGTDAAAKAPADGYTLLVADLGQVAINPALSAKTPYDPVRDFAPITRLGTTPFFLAVNASTGIASFSEWVTLVKAKPGQLSYGSSGNGSPHHLAMEMLKSKLGLAIEHIPYKGSGQSTPALLAGQVPMLFTVLPSVSTYVKAGTVRLLAQASVTRSPQAPDVPTFAELGVSDMAFLPMVAMLAPAGTPSTIIQLLAGELAKAVKHPESLQRFAALGIDPMSETPDAYATQLRADLAYYARAVRISGAKSE